MSEGPVNGSEGKSLREQARDSFNDFRREWNRLSGHADVSFSAQLVNTETSTPVHEDVTIKVSGDSDEAQVSYLDKKWQVPKENFLTGFFRRTKNILPLDKDLSQDNVVILFTKKNEQEVSDTLRKQIHFLETHMHELQVQVVALQESLSRTNKKQENSDTKILELQRKNVNLDKRLTNRKNKLKDYEIIIHDLQAKIDAHEKEIEDLKQQNRNLSAQTTGQNAEIERLESHTGEEEQEE